MLLKGVSVLSIIVAVIGGVMLPIMFFRELDRREAPPIIIEDPLEDGTIVVAVEGAVASPGLVSLASGSRWGDAIQASGGMIAGADASQVNLAARLADGEQVLIPTEAVVARSDTGNGVPDGMASPSGFKAPPPASGPLDLNRATAGELDMLPGIGPVLAERIIERRNAVGRFTSIDDLTAIRGISERMVEELRPLVTV